MHDQDEVLLLAALCEDEIRERKKKKIWVHEIIKTRNTKGEFHTLYPELRQDEERFYVYFRTPIGSFDYILGLIEEDIKKAYTNFRDPITTAERLAVTLRFLATGESLKTIGHSYRMGFTTVSQIINEVCDALWKHLQPIYMPEPCSALWERVIFGFEVSWQFPNCVGSIDGKHVTIKCPPNSGSNYYCYLKKFSIVLLAIVDHDYKFICVDIGGYGKNSDGGIFSFGQRLSRGSLHIPPNRALPGQNEETPCVLIGDEAFALTPFLMRPFSYRVSRHDIRLENYNKRLCRARRVVENAFGILAQKWRLFYRPLELKVETSIKVVKATCILHNYLRTEKTDAPFLHLLDDAEPVIGALHVLPGDGRRATNYAFQIRENFVNYFNM